MDEFQKGVEAARKASELSRKIQRDKEKGLEQLAARKKLVAGYMREKLGDRFSVTESVGIDVGYEYCVLDEAGTSTTKRYRKGWNRIFWICVTSDRVIIMSPDDNRLDDSFRFFNELHLDLGSPDFERFLGFVSGTYSNAIAGSISNKKEMESMENITRVKHLLFKFWWVPAAIVFFLVAS